MSIISPFRLNGAIKQPPSRQDSGIKNKSVSQPDAALVNTHPQDTLTKSSKAHPKFGMQKEQTTEEQEENILRTIAELKVLKPTPERFLDKMKNLTKAVGLHAVAAWVGDHIGWIYENLVNFADSIVTFIKDSWDGLLDAVFNS